MVWSQVWSYVFAWKRLADRLDELQAYSGRPLATVYLKESVFSIQYIFLRYYFECLLEKTAFFWRDTIFMKIISF